ncbi:MAG: nucleotidyltransferase family protein [Acidobacteriota bacterium]
MPSKSPKNKAQSSKAKDQVSAILLAAGRSRRMGAFKPLLPFGDSSVIESCIDTLRAAGIEKVIVVVGHRGEDVQSQLVNSKVSFAINPDPDSEMNASIACGARLVSDSAKALLIALVDHPAVPPEVLTQLIDEWTQDAKLVQPEYAGRGGHPVLIDLAYRQELLDLDPEKGLRALFATHHQEVLRVPVDSPYVARDMDTWEDYRRLHQDVFGVAPADI